MRANELQDFKKHVAKQFLVPLFELDALSDSQITDLADLIWDNDCLSQVQLNALVQSSVQAWNQGVFKSPMPVAAPEPEPTVEPGVRSVWRSTLISFEEFGQLSPPDRTAFFRHQSHVRFVYAQGSRMAGADGGFAQAVENQIMDATKWCNTNVEGLWTHDKPLNLANNRTKQGDAAYFRVRFLFENPEDFKKFNGTYLVLKKLSTDS